jgi:hypothetical protein
MAHASNPGYLGGRDQEHQSSRPEKVSETPFSTDIVDMMVVLVFQPRRIDIWGWLHAKM